MRQAFRFFAGRQALPCKMSFDTEKTFTASVKKVKRVVQAAEIHRYLCKFSGNSLLSRHLGWKGFGNFSQKY